MLIYVKQSGGDNNLIKTINSYYVDPPLKFSISYFIKYDSNYTTHEHNLCLNNKS